MNTQKPESTRAADNFLKGWESVSGKDVFDRRLFLEEFGGLWNKPLNKNLPPNHVFTHRLFMRAYSTFEPYIKSQSWRILTVSPGVSRVGLRIARTFSKSAMVLTSPDQKSVEVMKILASEFGLGNADIRTENPSSLPFPDASFEAILIDVTESGLPDLQKTLHEAARILVPGGTLFVIGINSFRPVHLLFKAFAGRSLTYIPATSLERDKIIRIAREAGLAGIKSRGFDPGYASYIFDGTSRALKRLGKITDFFVRALNRASSGAFIDALGLGLLIVSEKPIDKNQPLREALSEIAEDTRRPLPMDTELKRVEIIVLKYKDPEIESRCARQILENTDWPYKMNFFDNRPGTRNMSKVWNKLIRESTCDYVIIMDSDVFVPRLSPCWLTRLMKNFTKEDCYVSLPKVTTNGTDEQRASKSEDKPAFMATRPFAGMCTVYKKEIFEKVGYFDEDFRLRGSDTEWADRLLKSSYRAYISPDVLVEHVGNYSTKKSGKKGEYNRELERVYANTIYDKKRNSRP